MDNMNTASLVVVGSGIKFLSHLTHEAKIYITQSDQVLYLVNDPAMKELIKTLNPKSQSLDSLYMKCDSRLDSYNAIADFILETVRQNKHVCVVLYGHPCVFAQPALNAAIQTKKEGIDTKILPGISALDCLFSDLLINPASHGCQMFEATDFLIYNRALRDFLEG
ncbi:MAG: hypothetical protein JO149_04440 [Gammaproteobacteria bacterium]|nr:hypothetical protein [Gammaproteobacteria bacterium]